MQMQRQALGQASFEITIHTTTACEHAPLTISITIHKQKAASQMTESEPAHKVNV